MTERMHHKIALVTGAGSGIGKAAALRLAAEGAKVAVVDLHIDTAMETKTEIEQQAGQAIAIQANVSDPEQIQAAFQQVIDQWGQLDVVFANAGILGAVAPIEVLPVEEWDHTITNNVRGAFATVQAAIPHLKAKGGSIVLTSSVSGSRQFAQPGFAAYSTSKAAIRTFTKMAALELAQYHIRVNTVCPGQISTNIFESEKEYTEIDQIHIDAEYPEGDIPLSKKPGSPEEVASTVLFLASDEASHVTGTEIYIDGAETLLVG
ncbi:SDR family NAD(P)-dependent oxidoreductase [Paenibacillus sp. JX-17]|uniref:SDR family NAD(P)-dependent oxidoreductase n=1 Tax=Paenibacillus lacisoli TaxID=3064525 RepID=A0ABT9CCX0_9BACL|nr:SDR family NAD(P)-dependent oxidoreductase [Paenibacillus sp. JX-17]MDO7907110.1 SDR family NAD(P)-dependent oxidoreductase [Paenibacillus sp. JX-17]